MIQPLPTDTQYDDSPDTGWPECTCSRCNKMITDEEVPIRIWDTDDNGEVTEGSKEYRYCEACQEKSGISLTPREHYDEPLDDY